MSRCWTLLIPLRRGLLRAVAHMLKLRGAETVIVGIQPDVAFAMVQLGLTLEGVGTALDLEEGLAYLDRLIQESFEKWKMKRECRSVPPPTSWRRARRGGHAGDGTGF